MDWIEGMSVKRESLWVDFELGCSDDLVISMGRCWILIERVHYKAGIEQ